MGHENMLSDGDVNASWVNTLIYVVIAVVVETVAGVAGAALINQVKVGPGTLSYLSYPPLASTSI